MNSHQDLCNNWYCYISYTRNHPFILALQGIGNNSLRQENAPETQKLTDFCIWLPYYIIQCPDIRRLSLFIICLVQYFNLLVIFPILLIGKLANAQVGIGIATPDSSAALDVTDVTKGFLPPRLTTAQRNAIVKPASGLVIYNTTENCLQWHIGSNIWHNACSENLYQKYPPNTNFCNVQPTVIVDVVSGTGRTWMDRNLGANRAATSSTDTQSFGSLYQWGRAADGHQCVKRFMSDGVTTSDTTSTLASTDQPAHPNWILTSSSPNDWRSGNNNNRWNTSPQENNPCPIGYRVPTEAQLDA